MVEMVRILQVALLIIVATFFVGLVLAAPQITVNSPSNNSFNKFADVDINITLNETGSALFSVDGGINTTMDSTDNLSFNYTYSFAEGNHQIVIYANGTLNGSSSSTINLTVDTTPPNPNYGENTSNSATYTSNNYIYVKANATDNYLQNITIELFNATGGLVNVTSSVSSPHFVNFSGLTDGNYTFNVTSKDQAGNIAPLASRWVVIDTTSPSWSTTPTNQTINQSAGLSVTFVATDTYLDTYIVNDSTFSIAANGTLDNASTLALDVEYEIIITAYDLANNSLSKTISIFTVDEIDPNWDVQPYNFSILDNESVAVYLNATDDVAIDSYWVNDTDFNMSALGLLHNISTLSVGNYSLYVYVNDTSGNEISEEIIIEVNTSVLPDTTSPSWSSVPYNETFNYTDSYLQHFNATDDVAIDSYSINDSTYFSYNSSGHVFNTSTLVVGTYYFTLRVNDTSNNNLTSDVVITVVDQIVPVWGVQPANITRNTSVGVAEQYAATDNSSVSYSVNNVSFTINASGYMVNSTFLTPGDYLVTVYANDTYDNSLSQEIVVTVVDNEDPSWSSVPYNETFNYTDSYLQHFNATDDVAIDSYSINDSTYFSYNSSGHLYNTSFLDVGTYYFTLRVNDTSNNNLTSDVVITVVDNIYPLWSVQPSNITRNTSVGVAEQYSATDYSNISYLVDNVNYSINSSGFMVNTTSLTIGNQVVTIYANDSYGKGVYQEIVISIIDVENPSWISIPTNDSLNYTDTYMQFFGATDDSPLTYILNDTSSFTYNSSGYLYNTTDLVPSTYSLALIANDSSNNSISASIVITVVDQIDPAWSVQPSNITRNTSYGVAEQYSATDYSTLSYSIDDTSNFSINSSGYMSNVTELTIQNYTVIIMVNDTYDNSISQEIIVQVLNLTPDTINPTIQYESNTQNSTEYISNSTFSINITASDESSLANISLYMYNSSGLVNITTTTSANLDIEFITLSDDNYSFYATARDASNNSANTTLRWVVVDTTAPNTTITAPDQDEVIKSTSTILSFTSNELVTTTYSLNNDTFTSCTAFLSNSTSCTLSGMSNGDYSLILKSTDEAGNTQNTSVNFSVSKTSGGGGGGGGATVPSDDETNSDDNSTTTTTNETDDEPDTNVTIDTTVNETDDETSDNQTQETDEGDNEEEEEENVEIIEEEETDIEEPTQEVSDDEKIFLIELLEDKGFDFEKNEFEDQEVASQSLIKVNKRSKRQEVRLEDNTIEVRTTVVIDVSTLEDNAGGKIIEVIPKEFAESVSDMQFSIPPIILEDDPVVMWHLEDVKDKELTYTVKKDVSVTGNTIVLAEEIEVADVVDEVSLEETQEKIKDSKLLSDLSFTSLPPLYIVGFILAVSLLVFFIVSKHKKNSSKKPKKEKEKPAKKVVSKKPLPKSIPPIKKKEEPPKKKYPKPHEVHIDHLHHFIEEELHQGKSDKEIRVELIKAGWYDRVIDQAFHELKK